MRKLILISALLLLCGGSLSARPKSLGAAAQSGGACGSSGGHCTVLTWGASTTPGVTYNVYRGTATGAESATPLNSSPITVLTYTDPVVLTGSVQNFFYYIEAVETSSGIVATSNPSNEVSVSFPGIPASPTNAAGTPH